MEAKLSALSEFNVIRLRLHYIVESATSQATGSEKRGESYFPCLPPTPTPSQYTPMPP